MRENGKNKLWNKFLGGFKSFALHSVFLVGDRLICFHIHIHIRMEPEMVRKKSKYIIQNVEEFQKLNLQV